jgi:hypothetical protein
MPVATIRRSASLLRGRFTLLLISSVTAASPWLLLLQAAFPIAFVALGFLLFGSGLYAVIGTAAASGLENPRPPWCRLPWWGAWPTSPERTTT